MAWAEAAHPTLVLGQGHPRLHLLISSHSGVGREAGGAAHIASLAARGLEGHVRRCLLTMRVACACMLVCLWYPCLSARSCNLPPPGTWPPSGPQSSLSVKWVKGA